MRRRVHIAYVCADRGVPIGGCKGASAHVSELARALTAQGADLRIIGARVAADAGDLGPAVIDMSADRTGRAMRQKLFADAAGSRRQQRATETYALLLNQILAKELDRLHRQWGVDAIYERYSLWSTAAALFAHGARIPHLLEVNAPLREEQRRYRSLENLGLAATLEKYLFSNADYVLLPSAQLRPYVVQHGARAGAVRVTPNAASPGLLAAPWRIVHSAPERPFVVGFLGTLKPWHGLLQLLRAFRQLHRRSPAYRLLIAGDGPMRAELEKRVRQMGLQSVVTFKGEVPHGDVAAVLAQMDVAVAPYPPMRGFYFSPLKVFEYMAAGVPVVASQIGQLAEILRHERTALLHAPGNIDEMVQCIERLRRRPDLARKLATAARSLVRRRFTWPHNAKRVLGLIERHRARQVRQTNPRRKAHHGSR